MNKTNTGIEILNSYQKTTILLIYQKITLLSFSYCNLKNKAFTTEDSGHLLISSLPWYEAWPKTTKWGKSLFHLTGCSPSSREDKKGTRGRWLKQNYGRSCLEAWFSTATFHTTPAHLTMKALHAWPSCLNEQLRQYPSHISRSSSSSLFFNVEFALLSQFWVGVKLTAEDN